MSKSVKMWPPKGGETIKVSPHNVETMKRRGWSLEDTTPAPVLETVKPEVKKGKNDGKS